MSDELSTRLNTILWSFQKIILPACFIVGNLGNVLNLLIFSQRSSRQNPCLLYFLSASVINVVILNFALFFRVIRGIWNVDPISQSIWLCQGRSYVVNCAQAIYRFSVGLACLDRMCASSRQPWLRRISTKRIAHRLILANWIFHFLYFFPNSIIPPIMFRECMGLSNTVYTTYLTVQSLIQTLFISSIMIVCGLITVLHLKQMKNRVALQNPDGRDERQVIGQFLSMLFIQVLSDLLFNLLYPVNLIYTLVNPGPPTIIKSFLMNIALNLTLVYYSSGFYLYTLSSRSFREKLFRLFRQMGPHPRPAHTKTNAVQQIGMSTFRTGHTAM